MDHDADGIGVIEGRRRAIERSIVKRPFRRSELVGRYPSRHGTITRLPGDARCGVTSTKLWMSYGHPCKRTTVRPLLGPTSAYPTFRTPASICLSAPSALFPVVPAVAVVCATVLTVCFAPQRLPLVSLRPGLPPGSRRLRPAVRKP